MKARYIAITILSTLLLSAQTIHSVHADDNAPTKDEISQMSKSTVQDYIKTISNKSKSAQDELNKIEPNYENLNKAFADDNKVSSASDASYKEAQDLLDTTNSNLLIVNNKLDDQTDKIMDMFGTLRLGPENRTGTTTTSELLSKRERITSLADKLVAMNKLTTSELDNLKYLNDTKDSLEDAKEKQENTLANLFKTNSAALSKTDISKAAFDKVKEQHDTLTKQVAAYNDSSKLLNSKLDELNASEQARIRARVAENARVFKLNNQKNAIRTTLLKQGISSDASSVLAHAISTNKFIAEAASHLGTPYVWGGASPTGFDCSGLVMYSANKVGVSLPRVSQSQSMSGTNVSFDNLQQGDLLFFGGYGTAHHVAIYIGGGYYIHAPQPGENVKVGSIQWYTPDTARRVSELSGDTK